MHAHFRFYAGLNAFLPCDKRQTSFIVPFAGRVSLKDLIESLGVPHTEIDLVLVNGESADFSYLVADGDRISVYPAFATLDIAALSRVRPLPLREPRFVLDVHLGRLAAYLRMLGFDTLYPDPYDDDILASISSREQRILLTRDRGLLKRKQVTHGYYVQSTEPRTQVIEVARRFQLFDSFQPFKRCVHCNTELQVVRKEDIQDRLQPETRQYYQDFRWCPVCDRLYWQGSHYQRMQQFIADISQHHTAAD